jgi:peptidoglycan/LPS O-acetylase OafA/YrhL
LKTTIPSLTGVRGAAALWVFGFHLQRLFAGLDVPLLKALPFAGQGWSGVDLFFVLSGFVLMLTHEDDFAAITVQALRRFAVLRFTRVYPLSVVVLLLIAAAVALTPEFTAQFRLKNPENLTPGAFIKTALLATRWFLPGNRGDWNQPVWSLSVELLGYAGFPFAAWALRACSPRAAVVVALLSFVALAAWMILGGWWNSNEIDQVHAFARMLFCFLAGIALGRVRNTSMAISADLKSALTIGSCLVIVLACAWPALTVLLPTAFGALVYGLSWRAGPVDRLLSSAPMVFLGRISFPLYLVHVMALNLIAFWIARLRPPASSHGVLVAVSILAIMALAYALHRLVEKPAHQLGRRLAAQV